jgi:hypothetical protein
VTRRQRLELALMLIVRRAERDAGVPGHPHSDEPDTVPAIDQKPRPDDPGSQHPS